MIVYTLPDATTRTDTLVTVTNADETRTVTYTHLPFGATVPFTSTTTYTARQDGGAYGTGTYTAADGTTGTLASLVYKNGQAIVVSTDYTTAAGVTTPELRIEEKGNGGDTDKTLSVDATGALTVTTLTRFGGMHRHHP